MATASSAREPRGRRGPCGPCAPQQLTLWNIGSHRTGPMAHRCNFFRFRRLPDPGMPTITGGVPYVFAAGVDSVTTVVLGAPRTGVLAAVHRAGELDASFAQVLDGLGGGFRGDARGQPKQDPGGKTSPGRVRGGGVHAVV